MASSPKQKPPQWIVLSQAGVQLVVTVLFFCALGYWADSELKTQTPWFTLLGSLMGIVVAFWQFFKSISRL